MVPNRCKRARSAWHPPRATCLIDADPLGVPLVSECQLDQVCVDADIEGLVAGRNPGGDRRRYDGLAKQERGSDSAEVSRRHG